jgi:hypothetical protein
MYTEERARTCFVVLVDCVFFPVLLRSVVGVFLYKHPAQQDGVQRIHRAYDAPFTSFSSMCIVSHARQT